MDAAEAEVVEFLKSFPGQFVSAKEVCRRAGAKWRYREDERWALPVLQRLTENKLVEDDAGGHYRLVALESKNEKKRPVLSRVLQSGGEYGVIDLDKELDPEDIAGDALRVGSPQNAGVQSAAVI